jgi:hypothetical protein
MTLETSPIGGTSQLFSSDQSNAKASTPHVRTRISKLGIAFFDFAIFVIRKSINCWNIYKISISNNINIELEWLPGNKMYKLIILVKYLTLTTGALLKIFLTQFNANGMFLQLIDLRITKIAKSKNAIPSFEILVPGSHSNSILILLDILIL